MCAEDRRMEQSVAYKKCPVQKLPHLNLASKDYQAVKYPLFCRPEKMPEFKKKRNCLFSRGQQRGLGYEQAISYLFFDELPS